MSNAQFKREFSALMDRIGKNIEEVPRKVFLEMGGAIVEKSPVLSGRFRANWNFAINSPNFGTTETTDKRGSSATKALESGVVSYKLGDTLYFTNSLPYSRRLEYDSWSKQAPSGMVRTTIVEFTQHFRKVAYLMRNQ